MPAAGRPHSLALGLEGLHLLPAGSNLFFFLSLHPYFFLSLHSYFYFLPSVFRGILADHFTRSKRFASQIAKHWKTDASFGWRFRILGGSGAAVTPFA